MPIRLFFLFWVVFACAFPCAAETKGRFSSPEDLNHTEFKIGSEIGILALKAAYEKFPNATILEYPQPSDALTAIQCGKIDGFAYDKPALDYIALAHPELCVLPQAIGSGCISIVAAKREKALMDRVDEFLTQYYADGTYDEMYHRWVKEKNPKMPVIERAKNPVGKLIIGVAAESEPMCYYEEGHTIVGFDIELAERLALWLNMDYELQDLKYDSLFMACESGKIDLSIAQMDYTPERAETILFSKPYINSDFGVLIRRENYKDPNAISGENEDLEDVSFIQGIQHSFYKTFIHDHRWKLILLGLGITLLITFLAAIFGTVLAFPVCFARRSTNRLWRWSAKVYISIMQGTPILVLLMILFYVVFAKTDINEVTVAIIAFGLNFSAYAGEMLRAGIAGVPVGQREAALALGLTPNQAFWRVVLPQALRQVLPVYRGEFINMLKSTSVVGYIAIQDLTKMSDIIRSRTYEAFFPLVSTAAIYFVVAWFLTYALARCERKLDPAHRRAKKLAKKLGMRRIGNLKI